MGAATRGRMALAEGMLNAALAGKIKIAAVALEQNAV
jgi:hypothetical protein